MTDLEIREDIINTACVMLQKGLVQGTGGNFSARCAQGFIITPSGMDNTKLVPATCRSCPLTARCWRESGGLR